MLRTLMPLRAASWSIVSSSQSRTEASGDAGSAARVTSSQPTQTSRYVTVLLSRSTWLGRASPLPAQAMLDLCDSAAVTIEQGNRIFHRIPPHSHGVERRRPPSHTRVAPITERYT